MPLIQINKQTWRRAFSRILWNGPPLSGKTTGTMTLPRPCHLIVAPGELGYSSVLPEKDYHIYAWEYDANDPKAAAPRDVWKELQDTTTEILAGKKGEVQSLVIDGLHKLYDLVMRVEGWSVSMVDNESAGRQYVKYHATFGTYLSRVLGSGVPLVGATCYDGLEPVEPGSKMTQVFPMLPGKMAKEVMGMFPVVFHTEKEGGGHYYWSLKASGKMQAAGLHVPTRFLSAIPEKIEIVIDKSGEVKGGWKKIQEILGPLEAMVALDKMAGGEAEKK